MIPISHALHGATPEGWTSPSAGWNMRHEARQEVPCPTCGASCFQDPPCKVFDGQGNLIREDRKITCLACTRAERQAAFAREGIDILRNRPRPNWPTCKCGCGKHCYPGREYRKGHDPDAGIVIRSKQAGMMGAKLCRCRCGCKLPCKPGRSWRKGHEEAFALAQLAPEPQLPTPDNTPIPDNKEVPMSLCPCPCGQPVKPGNKYASKGCVGRARQGKPLSPNARANVAAANQRRAAQPVLPEVSLQELVGKAHDTIAAAPPGEPFGPVLMYGPEEQEAAKQMLHGLRRDAAAYERDKLLPPAGKVDGSWCPYAIVAELARAHDPWLYRAARYWWNRNVRLLDDLEDRYAAAVLLDYNWTQVETRKVIIPGRPQHPANRWMFEEMHEWRVELTPEQLAEGIAAIEVLEANPKPGKVKVHPKC